jgi:hypothetical protein
MTTPNEPQGPQGQPPPAAPAQPPAASPPAVQPAPPPWGRNVSRPNAAPGAPPKGAGAPPPKGAGAPPPKGAGAPPPKGAGPAPKGSLPAGAGRPPKRDLSDWKRHVLLRVGAPPFELRTDVKATIGRADECELAVPSNRVSRRHAEVFWKDGKPHLKDLGSQNGTLVNGKRITGEYALQDGDELEVGPFLCTYKAMPGVGSVGKGVPAADANALTQPMLADAMAGRLDQMSLLEVLQTLDFNKKTGTLEVFGTEGADGSIVVRDGNPVFARTERQAGEEAIYELLLQKTGQFSLSPKVEDAAPNVERPMMSILLEAGRRIDEANGPQA